MFAVNPVIPKLRVSFKTVCVATLGDFYALQGLRSKRVNEAVENLVVVGESLLTISGSRDWHQRLNIAGGTPTSNIVLDMSGVEKIDSACLQLLTAFVLKARASEVTLSWYEPSEHFLAAVNCLNLNAALGV